MRRYVGVAAAIAATLLLLFFLAEALRLPLLTDPQPWLDQASPIAAGVGVALLVVDVLLPVPSSLVMVAHGALFGVAVGAGLSLAGGLGAALTGFAIGRRGGPLLERIVGREERERADALLKRWGALAIVVSRPFPLLAETVAILAGASPLGWGQLTLAALAGLLPIALVYAVAGALAATFSQATIVFLLVLLMAALVWALGRWMERRTAREARSRSPPRGA